MTQIDNFVSQSTSTEGTGNLTLTHLVGFRNFSVFGTGSGNKSFYGIQHTTADEWEYGIGYLLSSTVYVRETVLGSSNANALVNFSEGTKYITNDIPAEYALILDSLGEIPDSYVSESNVTQHQSALTLALAQIIDAGTMAAEDAADYTPTAGLGALAFLNDLSTFDTGDLLEGSNLYFTDVRADARITAQKGLANGLATLDAGGKVPSSQLPAIALTDVSVVASESAQLALTAEEGDVAVRTDLNKSYIHNGGTSGTMADWQELLTPTDSVLSVNGMTGAVTLTTTNIAEGTNLYFTDTRARTAAVADSITNGVTDIAPSQNAVFDALALKADTSSLADYLKRDGTTPLTGHWTTGAFNIINTGSVAVDNLLLDGNTLSSTDANGNINISASGTGDVVIDSLSFGNNYISGAGGLVLTSDSAVTLDITNGNYLDLAPGMTTMNNATLMYFAPTISASGNNVLWNISPTMSMDTFITTFNGIFAGGTYENTAAAGLTWSLFNASPVLFSQTAGINPGSTCDFFKSAPRVETRGAITGITGGNYFAYQFNGSIGAADTSSWAATAFNGFVYSPTFTEAAGATFTLTNARAFWVTNPTVSGSPTITNFVGLDIANITAGTNIFGIRSALASASNKYFLRHTGTAQSTHRGNLLLDADNIYLGFGGASTTGGTPDATILYDGTNWLFNPQATGTGNMVLTAGTFHIDAGYLRIDAIAGSTTEGDIWVDSTQKALQKYVNGIEQTLSGVIFTQTADKTVANTTTKTTLFGTGIGLSPATGLPANFFVPGKTIRLTLRGVHSSTGGGNLTINAELGGTEVATTGSTPSGNGTDQGWEAVIDITCRTAGVSGTVVASGHYMELHSAGAVIGIIKTTTTTIDTTAAQSIAVNMTWATDSVNNTITTQTATVEVLN